MLGFLKTPKTEYTNLFDVARFKLAWRIGVFVLFGLTVFIISLLLTIGPSVILPTATGMTVAAATIILMKKTRKHELAGYIFAIAGFIITNASLYFFPEVPHLADIIWIINIVVYSYFALGKRLGRYILIINFISICFYIVFYLNDSIHLLPTLELADKIASVISVTVACAVLCFILHVFVQTTNVAENKYLKLTEELQIKNNEKDVLLKEIHHRVKNNLQVIISLMRLKSAKTSTEGVNTETIDRIRAMSLIHEKIYQSDDLAKIDLRHYLESLIADLISSHAVDKDIDFSIQSNVTVLKMKSLVPLALIFNELISNSIKHAFKNKSDGKITVNIHSTDQEMLIDYHDNGSWVEPAQTDTLGIELIESLTGQLLGDYQVNTANGTRYQFAFKCDE